MTNPDTSQPGGIRQTPPPGHPRVRVHVPVIDGLPREFIELMSVMARLSVFHSVLVEVVALGGMAPGLSDEQLLTALVGLGERASCELEGTR
jgi:hypothetical protein